MSETEDTWPEHYNPGNHKHLHALGVIAVEYAAFERNMDFFYTNRARKLNVPCELAEMYYFNINEENRIKTLRILFDSYPDGNGLKPIIFNLIDYFLWCRNCRNQLLHAERYPASFGGDPDTLYLTKRMGKQSSKHGYMKFTLRRLRFIADRFNAGVIQSADIHIRLRYDGVPIDKVHGPIRHHISAPLPKILRVPRYLELTHSP